MQLVQWIENNGHSQIWVAGKLGIPKIRLHRLCHGLEPTLAEVMAIETLTRRKVRMEDFLTQPKEDNHDQG
jgi:predicted XRE-type DNA-binding protein